MGKSGDGAKGLDDKCPICEKPWTKNHWEPPQGNTDRNSGDLVTNILQGAAIEDHSLYIKGEPAPQAHHIICVHVISKHDGECQRIGYDINRRENGVFLTDNRELACDFNLPIHTGGHIQSYYDHVEELVDQVFRKKLDGKKCDECTRKLYDDVISDLDDISSDVLGELTSFSLTLQRDGLNFMPGNIIGCNKIDTGMGKKNLEEAHKDAGTLWQSLKDIEGKREVGKALFESYMQEKYDDPSDKDDSKVKNIIKCDYRAENNKHFPGRGKPNICIANSR